MWKEGEMSETSERLGLPYLMPAQAQKHVTVNETLRRLDALVQLCVTSRDIGEQPETPAAGAAYILPPDASGAAWTGQPADTIAVYQDGAWAFFTPHTGWRAFLADAGEGAVFDGAAWRLDSETVSRLDDLERLGVGTAADDTNRVAVRVNSALWTARETASGGTGDLRYVLNKQDAANTLSILMQSGWSGRAELGLTGSDDFTLKLSPDGVSWQDVLRARQADGVVQIVALEAGALQLDAHTPLSASAPGQAGTLCWDSDFVYICVAPDTWKRAALASW